MEAAERVGRLLEQIERLSSRLGRVEVHPSFGQIVQREPALTGALGSTRRLWSVFEQHARVNHPLIPQYIDQLEQATADLSRALDALCERLGVDPTAARRLN